MVPTSIDFEDVSLIEVPVRLGGESFTLREADGEATIRYRNAISNSIRVVDEKPTGVSNIADAEFLLLSLCLFKDVGKNVLVAPSYLKRLKGSVLRKLIEAVKEISGLGERKGDEEDVLKNGRPGTPAGSSSPSGSESPSESASRGSPTASTNST